MSIKDFEMYHGIVLTKMVRSDHPVSLRMIETNKDEAWAAYRINDAATLYIKYRTKGRKTKRTRGLSWVFVFSEDEIREIAKLNKSKPVYFALVCVNKSPIAVCFLEPTDIAKCIDLKAQSAQNITVLYQRRKSLRVHGQLNTTNDDVLVVSQNGLDVWKVPGS